MSFANGDRVAAFFSQRFFSPQAREDILREEVRSLPWENPSARRIGTRVKEGSQGRRTCRQASGFTRHPLGYWVGEDEETRAMLLELNGERHFR